jgi:hypothetical protein
MLDAIIRSVAPTAGPERWKWEKQQPHTAEALLGRAGGP